jgi:hypothetical protein
MVEGEPFLPAVAEVESKLGCRAISTLFYSLPFDIIPSGQISNLFIFPDTVGKDKMYEKACGLANLQTPHRQASW